MKSLAAILQTLKRDLASLQLGNSASRLAELTAFLRFGATLSLINNRVVIEFEIEGPVLLTRFEQVLNTICAVRLKVVRSVPPSTERDEVFLVRIEDPSLARKLGLMDAAGKPVRGLPNHLALGSGEILKSVVRGAVLATGGLSDPSRNFALEVLAPNNETALSLMGAINRLSVPVKIRELRGSYRVTVRELDPVANLLSSIGAGESVRDIQDLVKERQSRNSANRLANFDDANLRRSAMAAVNAAARIERAIKILGDDAPEHLVYGGMLRLKHKDASLEELGHLAEPPMTKDAIAGRIRRLLTLADKRAKALGIPDTNSVLGE